MNKILLGQGLGDITFGMTREEVIKVLGEPTDSEVLEYSEDDEDTLTTLHYDELEASFGFDSGTDNRLVTIGVTSEECTLEGKPLIGLSKDDLEEVLETAGITDLVYDDDYEDELEMLSVEDKELSIWIDDNEVIEIQWGPFFAEDDEIIWPN